MAKAVFIASSHSDYDDKPGELYHFPNRQYLNIVSQTVGDWVIFYEGRRGGDRGYYAVQRVERITPDPRDPSHSYAILERASELSFENYVARLKLDGTPYESGLPKSGGRNLSAVRLLSDADFAAIVADGLREADTPDTIPRIDTTELAEETGTFEIPREMLLSSRKFRDASFARQVKLAYRARCAMSGLELRNGFGRPEVEAAHIIPVAANGPDSVRNGVALSGTLHWMFDRGLLSVDEDHSILIKKDSVADEVAARLVRPERKILLPQDAARAPNPAFLKWHRENVFKG